MVLDELIKEFSELVRTNQFDSALAACDRALSGKLTKTARARVLQWKARILVTKSGQWSGPAIECLKRAFDLTNGDPEERGHVLNSFAAAYASIGSIAECREYRRAFLELHRQVKSPVLDRIYPSIEFNFGLACHQAELLGAAEEAYRLSLAGYVSLQDTSLNAPIAGLKLNLIDVYQETDQYEEAYRLLLEVEKALPDEAIGAMVRLRRGLHALHKGDPSVALLQIESGLGHPSCDVRTRGALLLAKAKVLKVRGQAYDAHEYAMEAMQVAAKAYSSHLCHRVCRFLEMLARGE